MPVRSFGFPFPPVQLSLLDSRNKRLVHQGSPCPKHSSYHRNPFPFRICTALVLTTLFRLSPSRISVTLSSSTLFCSLILIVVPLPPFDTSSDSYPLLARKKNIGPREREEDIVVRLSLIDSDFVNMVKRAIFDLNIVDFDKRFY